MIGDVILFGLAADRYNLVGRAPVLNWVTYHAETAGHDVEVQFDQRTALRNDGRRRHYRFQVQGPNAMAVLEKALGHAPEDLKFFNMRAEQIAGVEVTALRHGMAGQPGWELFGPFEDGEAVHEALVSAGQDLGLTLVGGRAYGSNAHRVGLDPVAASGRLHRRGAHGLSRVAARGRLRGLGLRWAAASSRRTSRTTTSPLGTSATATSSSSTTTSSAARRSSGWRTASTAPR